MKIIEITDRTTVLINQLLEVWENSVKATHKFLSDEEIDRFLKVNRDYFENHGYKVYFTNARYEYKGGVQNVQPNELMIAFKE